MFIRKSMNEWSSPEEDWSVLVNRFRGEYREGDHTAMFEREGSGKDDGSLVTVLVRSSVQQWEAPYEEEVMTKEKQYQIIQRISSVFVFLGYTVYYED